MSANSKIEWTDHTFNPWWGCSEVSPGCDHCYARKLAERLHPDLTLWGPKSQRLTFEPRHWNEPLSWNRKAEKAGRRDRVFCASMADVFDNQVDLDEERAELWTLIHKTPYLDWLLLTKRIANVVRMVPSSWLRGHWPRNAWLGISVVNQEEADRDIPKLLVVPARVRFLSMEPLLGPVHLRLMQQAPLWSGDGPDAVERSDTGRGIHWVIVGGESGPGARPTHPDWARSLRDQCEAASVPFLFKQWGEWGEAGDSPIHARAVRPSGATRPCEGTHDMCEALMEKVGKKAAGRLLDGREWNGVPG